MNCPGERINLSGSPSSSLIFSSFVAQKPCGNPPRPSAKEIVRFFAPVNLVKLRPSLRSTDASPHCLSSSAGSNLICPASTAVRKSTCERIIHPPFHARASRTWEFAQSRFNWASPFVVKNEPRTITVRVSSDTSVTVAKTYPSLLLLDFLKLSPRTKPEIGPSMVSRVTRNSAGKGPGLTSHRICTA